MTEPGANATASASLVVTDADLASAVALEPGDAFPRVLATARMVALMEVAASRVLRPCLGEGAMSVGVSVEIEHTAPTPPGTTITATARYVGREGKLFVFEVTAQDPAGEVGKGRHKRAIVSADRLERGAARRASGTSS